jgi:hypothetical protein
LLETNDLEDVMTLSLRSRGFVVLSFIAVGTATGLACSVDDENPATSRPRGTDAGSNSSSGGEGGTTGPTGAPICGTYGGPEGAKAIANEIINKAKADCRIGPTIGGAAGNGHATQCFQLFVQNNFQCPGITFIANQTKDAKGETCNSRFPDLDFSNEDFNAFLQAVSDGMKAKNLTADDIRSVLPAFEGARLDLTNGSQVPKGKYTSCAANCQAGGDKCDLPQPPQPDAGNDAAPEDAGDSGT